jgi:hypothetical protein
VWQETKQAVKNLKWFLIFALFALILLSVFPISFDVEEPIGDLNQIPETPSQQTQTTIDSEDSSSTISTEPNPNLSENTGLTETQPYDQKWWIWVILLSPPLIALLWYLWQRYKAPPYLTRKSTSQTPNIKQFFAKDINEGFFQSVGLARVAQQLRKHTPITTDLLDLKATIKRTIKAGGWFTPVTGIAKTIPEYLVFIDRTTFKDHHSHFIDALVNQLIFAGDNYHNPANLKIETLRNAVPSISFRIDDTMQIRFRSDRDGYVFVFNIEPDGKLISFFPNRYCHDPQQSYKQEKS